MKKRESKIQPPGGTDEIARYAEAQSAEHAAICHALRTQIDAVLPKTTSKIWHGGPVWFVGENPVVGYNVTAKKGVNLLFWNGQSFGDAALKAAGTGGRAAQIQFTDAAQIDIKTLRGWLKRAGTDVFDSVGHFRAQRALRKKAKP
jgi:hypothetical protein